MKQISVLLLVLFSLSGMKAQTYNYSVVADFNGTSYYGRFFEYLYHNGYYRIPSLRLTRNYWVSDRFSIGHSAGYSYMSFPVNCWHCYTPDGSVKSWSSSMHNIVFDLNLKYALNRKSNLYVWVIGNLQYGLTRKGTTIYKDGSSSSYSYDSNGSYWHITAGLEWLPFKARNIGFRLGGGSLRYLGSWNNPGFILSLGMAYHFNPVKEKPINLSSANFWETGLGAGFHYQSSMFSTYYSARESNSEYLFSYGTQLFARLHTSKNLRHLINLGIDNRSELVVHISNDIGSGAERFEETYRQQIATAQYALEYLIIARDKFNLYGQVGLGYSQRLGFDFSNNDPSFYQEAQPVFPKHALFQITGVGVEHSIYHGNGGSLWLGWENSIMPIFAQKESRYHFGQKLTYQSLLRLGWRFD